MFPLSKTSLEKDLGIYNCLQRHNFLTNRVVNVCNALPQNAIDATSINYFKAKIDDWMINQGSDKLKLLP
ncbi:hypothetical protein BpHYR1_030976 [Brachionus plicatilis]|uniref:Uncharacterized protein n=1 Tax=Brachionus plicatilis TaxID=10195 RepID=A0A3M7SWJ3_BRAPC|nr:hypothetical protein BpHYR1_030976 [Brachionus plicatilis]